MPDVILEAAREYQARSAQQAYMARLYRGYFIDGAAKWKLDHYAEQFKCNSACAAHDSRMARKLMGIEE